MNWQRIGLIAPMIMGAFLIFSGGDSEESPEPNETEPDIINPETADLLDAADDEYRQKFADAVELFADQKWTEETAAEWVRTIGDVRKETHAPVSRKVVRAFIDGNAKTQIVPALREGRLFGDE